MVWVDRVRFGFGRLGSGVRLAGVGWGVLNLAGKFGGLVGLSGGCVSSDALRLRPLGTLPGCHGPTGPAPQPASEINV